MMKARNIKILTIFLILLCCFMGAASAAEDISADAVDDAIDDVVLTDEVVDADLPADDSISAEPADAGSDMDPSDAAIEADDGEGNTRATNVTVNNWAQLASNASSSGDKIINLASETTYNPTSQIVFGNNAKIVGTSTSYISGSYSGIPFYGSNTNYQITFENVNFKDLSSTMLIQMLTSGTTVIKGCTFENVNASSSGHNSVIYNNYGTMNITDCVFRNCKAAFGVITNHNSGSTTAVTMNVRNCTFENNYGYTEPGVINNCGILYVWDSVFNNNEASQWAGAIHTHSNAQTYIDSSNFTGNIAGWNGGALYTYSKLVVCNSIFYANKCRTSAGGGAIGCSNWGSSYNITICNCTFEENRNLCGNTPETPSTGTGGAISAMNNGILKVCNSTFIHNVAKTGQAIAAYSQGYISPEGNITEGIPKVIVCNNTFINHTLKTSDTVKLTGNYTFSFNTFTHCYQTNLGTNNTFNNPVTSNNPISSEELFDSQVNKKLSSKNILGDNGDENILGYDYQVDPDMLEEWYNYCVENNDILYLEEGNYENIRLPNNGKNITFIGLSKDAIFTSVNTVVTSLYDPTPELTFINLTFNTADFTMNSHFINCTFINSDLKFARGIAEIEYLDEKPFGVTYNFTFDDCEFKDANIVNSIFTVYKYGKVVLNNCTFDNIVADSIIGKNGDFIDQDGIYLYECKFTNCNIKGVVDIPGNIEILDFLKVVAVDSVVDISSSEKGTVTVTLTDKDSNPIAGATFKYTVNGGDEQTAVTGGDGKYAITGLTGEVTVAVNYEGNESYNAIGDSKFFNFTEEPVVPAKVATKITAPRVSAVYNVAKNLVITLTDKDGKVLANKKVTIKVGTISKTLNTNAKGQVSLNVATLVPKTYTASVKFAGDDAYLASSVSPKVVVSKAKPKITAKAKTFKVKVKTKKYTVTLKNNKGKVMKKVKLTLKVGKKTYKATTNSKGKATFKITKLNKKGKYTATVKFAGSKYYKALSKKVKITVKK